MIVPLFAMLVVAAEGFFFPPLHPAAQPPGVRGHIQGNDYYVHPDVDRIEESLDYKNRFLYQGVPQYQHSAESQRFYSQAAVQQAYGPPAGQVYQPPERLTEPIYSDVRDFRVYVQPHDDQTVQQQTLNISPQYLSQQGSQPATNEFAHYESQSLGNQQREAEIQGLRTTAQTTIPVLVKLNDNQALIVPVRAVYALPGFLERLVQRVQGYYSVYNPVENLVVDRPYFVSTADSSPLPQNVELNVENTAEPNKVQTTQAPSKGSIIPTSAYLTPKLGDVKSDATVEETSTARESDDDNEVTTLADTGTTEKAYDGIEHSTEPIGTTDRSPSSPEETTSMESSPIEGSPSSSISATTDITSTIKPAINPEAAISSGGDSASSDLDSAGYTYYAPVVPFHYPHKK